MALIFFIVTMAFAQAPTFYAGQNVQYLGADLRNKYDGSNYNYYSVPCVCDWNGDNVKDLLVGYFYYGNVYFYPNTGTNTSPIFNSWTRVQANNTDISVGYG